MCSESLGGGSPGGLRRDWLARELTGNFDVDELCVGLEPAGSPIGISAPSLCQGDFLARSSHSGRLGQMAEAIGPRLLEAFVGRSSATSSTSFRLSDCVDHAAPVAFVIHARGDSAMIPAGHEAL